MDACSHLFACTLTQWLVDHVSYINSMIYSKGNILIETIHALRMPFDNNEEAKIHFQEVYWHII